MTTILGNLGAMNPPTSGRVAVDGLDIYTLSVERLSDFPRQYLGLVFQQLFLVTSCTPPGVPRHTRSSLKMERKQMTRTPGLRLKFNLALVPIVAVGIAIMIWADYRHEYGTLMEAHAAHTSTIGSGGTGAPIDPWTLPDVAARRSLIFHLVYGGALVAFVFGTVNVVLGWYILRPIALMRQRLTGLQRGQWRGPVDPSGNDELGTLSEGFQQLGPEIDALVGHILHAERLSMIAMVSRRFEQHAEPEVKRIVGIAGRLARSNGADDREDSEQLARAAAHILQAVHEYDAVFAELSGGKTSTRERKVINGAGEAEGNGSWPLTPLPLHTSSGARKPST